MLIKEYRIPLPMSVEEYRIAQLYMIAKKSREETKGSGSGVEILVNEPYTSGPGGSGQFTHKVYHVGSHLPGWFPLPRTALTVEEEAWNAYPYTKTRYRSPFVEKFSLEIETYYFPDGGHQDNVFSLSDSEKRNRIVDLIDVVKDQDATFEDPSRDDPTVYVSQKTGRGPLSENWIEEYWEAVQRQKKTKGAPTKSIMCAYKLCKVEFRYWGLQSKIERFIHDTALRKTMLKAHLQAWVWQDEWYGLNMEDIRALEQETAELLRQALRTDDEGENAESSSTATDPNSAPSLSLLPTSGGGGVTSSPGLASPIQKTFESIAYPEKEMPQIIPKGTEVMPRRSVCLTDGDAKRMAEACSQYLHQQQHQVTEVPPSSSVLLRSKSANAASLGPKRSRASRDEDSEDDDEEVTEEDEFFDCRENLDDSASLAKWSSMELLPYEENGGDGGGKRRTLPVSSAPSMESTTGGGVAFRRVQSLRECSSGSLSASRSEEDLLGPTPPHSASAAASANTAKHPVIDIAEFGSDCATSVLLLVAHGGSVLDVGLEASVRKADVTTFRGALEHVTRAHYPGLVGRVAVKCVPCPPVCEVALNALSALSPYSFDVNLIGGFDSSSVGVSVDRLPVAAIPLLATANAAEYSSAVARFVAEANRVYTDFLVSDAGRGFMGQVCLVGDSVGGLLAYDALCNSTCTCVNSRSKHTSGSTDGNFLFDAASAHSAESTLSPAPPPPPPPSSPRESTNLEQGQQGYLSHHNSLRLAPNRIAGGEFFPLSDSTDNSRPKLDFDVTDFFLFGSPLGTLLAHRRAQQSALDLTSWPGRPAPASCALHPSRSSAPCSAHHSPSALASATSAASSASAGVNLCSCCSSSSVPFATNRPPVAQVYNLFHPTDPLACRVEPLLCGRLSRAPPVNVARYHKYPMGDGQALSIIEFVHTNPGLFANAEPGQEVVRVGHAPPLSRRVSEDSVASSAYDVASNIDDAQQLQAIAALKTRWWGTRRVDFALYCPEGLSNLPANALPHIFHSSYWESPDVVAFVVRQMVRGGGGADRWTDVSSASVGSVTLGMGMLGVTDFVPGQPREKWLKKRTSVKIRNGAPNHRANDVLVREGAPQQIVARFAYGPLDMSALTGERVDVYVIKEPPAGEWVHVATEVTDKSGRLAFTLPPSETLGYGLYPVRIVVRGDHSMLHLSLAVVPPRTETVVFSIDGSFAASVSVTGKDPKVKAGAVDVVRHWQELGYLILYVTGRPDMQLQRVVSWLAQHNFPHGLVSFADGFTTDPLRHKAEYLRSLVHDNDVVIHCAYGSSKDIGVYASLGLKSDQIYIEGGKPSRKQAGQATFLTEGYAEHLARLTAFGGSRPAQGNARMVLPKTSLGLPWQAVPMAGPGGLGRRRTMRQTTAKRTTSFPLNTFQAGVTTPAAATAATLGATGAVPAHQRQTSTAEGDSKSKFLKPVSVVRQRVSF